jgi:hypothetical protein
LLIVIRVPFEPEISLTIASSCCTPIVERLRDNIRSLKRFWPIKIRDRIFHIRGPTDDLVPDVQLANYDFFAEALKAYCAAYDISEPVFEFDLEGRYLQLRVLPPDKGSAPYSALQLVAILRALRYNTDISSLCFRGIDLSILLESTDKYEKGESIIDIDRRSELIISSF